MKIFVNTPYSQDANSFWRCMGPLSYMAKASQGKIQIHLPLTGQQIYWDRLSEFDVIFLHRPCRMEDLTVIQIARNLNIPVWADFDDWLFHLPDWNPNAAAYHQAPVQHWMAACLACADVITVSTSALEQKFLKVNPQTVIVPNAYRSDLFPYRKKEMPERKPIYVWRGTNTHDGDLLSVREAFPKLKEKIHFLGSPSFAVTSQMDTKNFEKKEHIDTILYWKSIFQLAPQAFLFPLKDCFFNHCKSNIAWLEAIHAGAVCVAPKTMGEWQQPGIIGYDVDNSESFLEAADMAMAMSPTQIQSAVSDAYEYIRGKYDIQVINQFRTELVHSILSPTFERNTRDPYHQMTGMWALSELKK